MARSDEATLRLPEESEKQLHLSTLGPSKPEGAEMPKCEEAGCARPGES